VIDLLSLAASAETLRPGGQRVAERLLGYGSLAKLTRLVAGDLKRMHELDAGKRIAVAETWTTKRADPDLTRELTAWLASGDDRFVVGATRRWRELLDGDPDLALTSQQVVAIVEVTATSMYAHLSDAQPDERAATHAEVQGVRHLINASHDELVRALAQIAGDLVVTSELSERPLGRVRFNLPVVAAAFTGRSTELGRIDKALKSEDRAVVTQAIAGLGGVGKSQLAARYVELHAEEYEIVAWVSAQDSGVADLARLADRIGVAAGGEVSPADRAQSMIAWLAECEHSWLLVFDNVESAEQLKGLLPRGSAGRVLVTSRDRTLGQFGVLLTVDVFDEDTATDYLVTRAERPGDKQAARELGRALGCLPLALAHAGAYCAEGVSFTEYHAQLTDLPARELFDSHPEVFL